MANLLEETIDFLMEHNLKPEDVDYIKKGKKACSWHEFSNLAKDLNYDDGFGRRVIPLNLKIVGKDWWLERSEYDGAEGWNFKHFPIKVQNSELMTKRDLIASDIDVNNRTFILTEF